MLRPLNTGHFDDTVAMGKAGSGVPLDMRPEGGLFAGSAPPINLGLSCWKAFHDDANPKNIAGHVYDTYTPPLSYPPPRF